MFPELHANSSLSLIATLLHLATFSSGLGLIKVNQVVEALNLLVSVALLLTLLALLLIECLDLLKLEIRISLPMLAIDFRLHRFL